MYKLGKYYFEGFTHKPGHSANYAVLTKPVHKKWGIKYSPIYCYSHEHDILNSFSHPQIPSSYDYGREELFENGKSVLNEHYIVLEHYEGEDVVEHYKKKRLPKIREIKKIIRYFSSAAEPLRYLHSNGFVHTDIKPGHIIINPETETAGLIDLKLTIEIGEVIKGISWDYASPEQKKMTKLLRNLPKGKGEREVLSQVNIDGRADLYSIGLILYEILTGRLWAYTRKSPIEINKLVPQKLDGIVMGLLEHDPSNRIPSAEKFKEELERV